MSITFHTWIAAGLCLLFSACSKDLLLDSRFVKKDQLGTLLPEFMKQNKGIDLYKDFQKRKIYRIVFEEKFVNNNSIRQKDNLPKETPLPTENYYNARGNYQELYLVRYEKTYPDTIDRIEIRKENDILVSTIKKIDTVYTETMFVFYSFKFDAEKKCIGAAPIRIGKMSTYSESNGKYLPANSIRLNYEVTMKKKKGSDTELEIAAVKKSKEPIQFVLSKNTDEHIVVSRIVAQHNNKIGGEKPLIFDMEKMRIMPGSKGLEFKRWRQYCAKSDKTREFQCYEIEDGIYTIKDGGPYRTLEECCGFCNCDE